MKLSIIMPVYNEARYFEKILGKVRKVRLPLKKEIIIVESNSTDGTREIVKKYENIKDIKIIYQEKALGKGNAIMQGLKKATGDIILIQDADLEYDPRDYNKLIAPILKKEVKFVIGSRKMGHKTWQIRSMKTNKYVVLFVNVIANLADEIFNLLYDVHLTDPQSMYKVFHKDCLKGVKFKSNRFDWDWEICARFIRKGIIPIEFPIAYNSRDFSEGKKINIAREIFLNATAIIKYRFLW
ncbi:MAG: glycosyltransferase family 2 protein [Candidatus Altiarchaeota archaeon]|nr:glycosyltransferase family 2 protein [Candidatus Altiarchaeota archaeon]